MSYIVAVTQPTWIAALRSYGHEGKVNFWRPGQQPLSAKHYGSPLLFLEKGREPRRVPGFGIIEEYQRLTIREAWAEWGVGNGVASLEEFVQRMAVTAKQTSTNSGGMTNRMDGADTVIGCVVLRDVHLLPDSQIPTIDHVIPGFPRNVVSYKSFEGPVPPLFSVPFQTVAASQADPGYGIILDPEEKRCIEVHAMEMCRLLFPNHEVLDVSTPELALQHVMCRYPGYDVLVRKGATEYHIEVKGTKLEKPMITITQNELLTAANDERARLLVVSGIKTYQHPDGWKVSSGRPILYTWADRASLRETVEATSNLNRHGLSLRTPEWVLDVHRTALLSVSSDVLP